MTETQINFIVQIDWDDDQSFDTVGDDITDDIIDIAWSEGMKKTFQSVADESVCTVTLRNDEGKYNPENPSSPYAGKLLPRKSVKVSIELDGVTEVYYRGWIEDIRPNWEPQGDETGNDRVVIECWGAKQRLQEADINLALQENKRSDEVIAEILKLVVLPPATTGGWILGAIGFSELGLNTILADVDDYSDLETGNRTFPYFGDIRYVDQNEGSNAYRMIHDAVEAEPGKFFFQRDGKAVFWNSDNILDYQPVDYTVEETGIHRPQGVGYVFGQNQSNMVKVTVYPRAVGNTITLWELDKELTILPGETQTFEAPFTDNKGLRAGGRNISVASSNFSSGTGTITLTEFAERAEVSVTNTGSVNAVLDTLEIEGEVLESQNNMVLRAQDDDSIFAYGKRGELSLNLRALDNPTAGQDVADLELIKRKDARGEVLYLRYLNAFDGVSNAHQLYFTIGVRLRVVLDNGHDAQYIIMGEYHRIYESLTAHESRFYLERLLKRIARYKVSNLDSWVKLQGSDAKEKLAQSFQLEYDSTIDMIRVRLKKIGDPNGTITLSIWDDGRPAEPFELGASLLGVDTYLTADTGEPDTELTSVEFGEFELDSVSRWITQTLDVPVEGEANRIYWVVIETDRSTDGSNYVEWGADGSSPSYSDGAMLYLQSSVWTPESKDAIFEVYEL